MRYPLICTLLLLATLGGIARPQEGGGGVKKQLHVLVPMRDGIRLSVDVYRPDHTDRVPTVLLRTPYDNKARRIFDWGMYFARHGYAFVAQDSRGRHDSEGGFIPLVNEGRDGFDTIEWIAEQPWSSGRVGTIGGSYEAWNQWFAALEQSEHLAAMVSIVSPPDPFLNIPYQGGAFQLIMAEWMILVDARTMQNLGVYDFTTLYRHLPILTMDEAAGRRVPWWRDWITHDRIDSYWKPINYQQRLQEIDVPALHVSGWFDDDLFGTLSNYQIMASRARTERGRRSQRLVVGAWPHGVNSSRTLGDIDFGPDAIIDLNAVYREFFDCHLRSVGCEGLARKPPVDVFVMGENRWRHEQSWPPPGAQPTAYYFRSGGRANTLEGDGTLSLRPPDANEPADEFIYDPADPVPHTFVPGRLQLATTEDQRPVETRPDVLVYTSAPLEQATEVTGPLEVKLWAATDGRDTDWTAKLVDVHPHGYAQRLQDGVIRARYRDSLERPSLIEPGRAYPYTIDLWATAHVFLPGHRIRVEISSSNFPRFSRNLNTGDNSQTTTAMRVARQRVYHDAVRPSHITLPLVARERAVTRP